MIFHCTEFWSDGIDRCSVCELFLYVTHFWITAETLSSVSVMVSLRISLLKLKYKFIEEGYLQWQSTSCRVAKDLKGYIIIIIRVSIGNFELK